MKHRFNKLTKKEMVDILRKKFQHPVNFKKSYAFIERMLIRQCKLQPEIKIEF